MADTSTPNFDYSQFSGDLYKQWEQGMSTWWDQVLENPDFLKALGGNLSMQSKARKAYEKKVDENLEKAHLPTRSDLVRVARIATLLEDKLLQIEDTVLDIKDHMGTVEKEALKARLEAGETRLSADDRLSAIEAKLEALMEAVSAKAPSAPKAAAKSTAKKSSAKKGGAA